MALKLKWLWNDRKHFIGRQKDALVRWFAWHLPRRLVMWCYFRVGAHATTGEYANTVVPDLTMMDAIKRWNDK
jgi:hypothetical protein